MLLFVLLLLGATVFLGGAETDTDADTEIELDADAGAIEVDSDLDIDVDSDLDVDIDTDVDIETDLDIDSDANVEIDTDVDSHIPGTLDFDGNIDTDIDTDIHTEVEADIDTELNTHAEALGPANINAHSLTDMHTDQISSLKRSEEGRYKKRSIPLVIAITLLEYLNAGKVPLSVIISSWLALWAIAGLFINAVIVVFPGGTVLYSLPFIGKLLFAGVFLATCLSTMPLVRSTSKALRNVFDTKNYTSAKVDYIGSTAKVVSHTVPAYKDVQNNHAIGILDYTDRYGTKQKLYAFVPDDCETTPKYNDNVIIIDYHEEKRLYEVLVENSNDHINWENVDYTPKNKKKSATTYKQ